MGLYDSRPVTLDPGLTILALRGLRERNGHYPFIERFLRRGRLHRYPVSRGSFWHRAVSWLVPHRRPRVAPDGPSVST